MFDRNTLFGVVIGVGALALLSIVLVPGDSSTFSSIPPTNAFSKIFSAGQSINATSFDDDVTIITQGSFTVGMSGNTLTFKIVPQSCPAGQAFTSVDSNGFLICSEP